MLARRPFRHLQHHLRLPAILLHRLSNGPSVHWSPRREHLDGGYRWARDRLRGDLVREEEQRDLR